MSTTIAPAVRGRRPRPHALKAIVSEGASGRSVRDDFANGGVPWQNRLGDAVGTVGTALFTSNTPPERPEEPRRQDRGIRPVFFIYGEHGQPVEKPANTGFYAEAKGTKEIWEVPGSKHMGGMKAQPEEYERRVVGFFDRTLLKK